MGFVSHHGVPSLITSDRGSAFISDLWKSLADLLGFSILHCPSYTPNSNGLVERLHRELKSKLEARLLGNPNWFDALYLVLMGMRAAFKEDIGCSSAEMVQGEQIRLPGQFMESKETTNHTEFSNNLKLIIDELRPIPTQWHRNPKSFISKDLKNSTHVFVRIDGYKKTTCSAI